MPGYVLLIEQRHELKRCGYFVRVLNICVYRRFCSPAHPEVLTMTMLLNAILTVFDIVDQ